MPADPLMTGMGDLAVGKYGTGPVSTVRQSARRFYFLARENTAREGQWVA